MLTQQKIDKFYEDVAGLGLKKPVAIISRATGDGKGNVSKYLNRKLEPSEEFIDRFYEKFGSSIKVVSRAGHKKPSDSNNKKLVYDSSISVREYVDRINQHTDYLQGLLALSLHDLSKTQKDMYAHLKGAIKRQAERYSKMDPEKMREELDKISIYAAEIRMGDEKEGIAHH